ncbi:MAG: hypothetical protein QOE55_2055 [Acidobacteriaceae bacterium]|nr:hypothetical protein [Acidobacteriaceae bacterium]
MTHPDTNSNEHERFRELAAAMTCGVLTAQESAELEYHLHACEPCLSVFREYQILASDGFALLARSYEHNETSGKWNEGAARRRLLSTAEDLRNLRPSTTVRPADRRVMGPPNSTGALAASLLLAVGIGAWQLGNWYRDKATLSGVSLHLRPAQVISAESTVVSPIAVQSDDLARLQAESAAERLAFEQLQSRFQDLQDERAAARADIKELTQTKIDSESRLNQVSMQRDQSLEQLRKAHQAYDLIAAELAGLRAEREKVKLQLANVETRIGELTALNQEQERRLRDNEQYLSSDRDIRDLMSARNLYIADVFDVDGHSHTRKPFGRVFFTRGKSLLFYAFDLDQQSHFKSASTFQVWGERETVQNETAHPIDLGILYLDSEANRRWSLHFDNPQTLSEIDAVFVTVEPNGGSLKPTGRPFLFATLQKQANHP